MSDNPLAEFEKLGEDEVRLKLAKGHYGSQGHRWQQVQVWLRMKELARSDLSMAESLRVARSAKNAAWIAATVAIAAAMIAIISIPSVLTWVLGLISWGVSR